VADQADLAVEREVPLVEAGLAAARANAAAIPAGVPGECESCGDDSPRLVAGWCALCRDGRRTGSIYRPVRRVG
jgi:hypothetical protein